MWFSPSSLYKIPTLLSPTTTRKTKPFLCLHPTIKSKFSLRIWVHSTMMIMSELVQKYALCATTMFFLVGSHCYFGWLFSHSWWVSEGVQGPQVSEPGVVSNFLPPEVQGRCSITPGVIQPCSSFHPNSAALHLGSRSKLEHKLGSFNKCLSSLEDHQEIRVFV